MTGRFFSKYLKYKKKYLKLRGGSANQDITNTFNDQYIASTFNDLFNDISNKSITKVWGDNLVFVLTCENPIQFTLNKKKSELYIDDFYKCYKLDSKKFLERIISFARDLKIKTVRLQDASNININNCYINLPELYIFLYGISWYNQFGLKSKTFQDEVSTNEPIRNITFFDFVKNGADILKSKKIDEKLKEIDRFFTFDDIIYEQLSEISTFTPIKLYIIYNRLINLYKTLDDTYNQEDIIRTNEPLIDKIEPLISSIKKFKIENGEKFLEKKDVMKRNEHSKIVMDNNRLLQNVHWLFSEFKKQFDEENESKTEQEVNNILANLQKKYQDESISFYEISDSTPIKNIVRIIYYSRLDLCESIKTKLLIEIIQLSRHLFMYDSMLSLNIET